MAGKKAVKRGAINQGAVAYDGGSSNVMKEARERKSGGRVALKTGGKAGDAYKTGGACAKPRMDKKASGGRAFASGGKVGAYVGEG